MMIGSLPPCSCFPLAGHLTFFMVATGLLLGAGAPAAVMPPLGQMHSPGGLWWM